jgi:hypothetical protein
MAAFICADLLGETEQYCRSTLFLCSAGQPLDHRVGIRNRAYTVTLGQERTPTWLRANYCLRGCCDFETISAFAIRAQTYALCNVRLWVDPFLDERASRAGSSSLVARVLGARDCELRR